MHPEPLVRVKADEILKGLHIKLGDLPDVLFRILSRIKCEGTADREGMRPVRIPESETGQDHRAGFQDDPGQGRAGGGGLPEEVDHESPARASSLVAHHAEGAPLLQYPEDFPHGMGAENHPVPMAFPDADHVVIQEIDVGLPPDDMDGIPMECARLGIEFPIPHVRSENDHPPSCFHSRIDLLQALDADQGI